MHECEGSHRGIFPQQLQLSLLLLLKKKKYKKLNMKWNGEKTDSNFSSEATSIGWCTIVLLCVTELLAEPLNFYGDILLCFEKGLLKCISATHFLKKERARIWNITIEGIKRVERREKSGMQSFFFKSLAQPSRDLFVCRRLDTAKFYPFLHPPSSSSSSFFLSSAVANLFSGSIK